MIQKELKSYLFRTLRFGLDEFRTTNPKLPLDNLDAIVIVSDAAGTGHILVYSIKIWIS